LQQRGLVGWVFNSKSEDQNRQSRENKQRQSTSIESFIRNSIKAGQRIGECDGTPEGRREFVDIG
jgi:hypothetical protein